MLPLDPVAGYKQQRHCLSSVGAALLREKSGFSGPMPRSAIASGGTPEKGNEEQEKRAESSQLQLDN
jgi:hypothetical protein